MSTGRRGVARLADPVQDTRRENRLRLYAEQAKDTKVRVQKALRHATAQVQEVRILRDSATTMVVDATDHMQQQAAGVESYRMSVETARQEVVAPKGALEFDSCLVQRPEQRPVCAFREEEQSQHQSNDTVLADMGVTLWSLKERWPLTEDRIEQQISAVNTRLEALLKGNADAHREIRILQGWSQEDKADHRRREARIKAIENKLDAVNAAANNGVTSESVDWVVGIVREDVEVLKDALDEVRQRCVPRHNEKTAEIQQLSSAVQSDLADERVKNAKRWATLEERMDSVEQRHGRERPSAVAVSSEGQYDTHCRSIRDRLGAYDRKFESLDDNELR